MEYRFGVRKKRHQVASHGDVRFTHSHTHRLLFQLLEADHMALIVVLFLLHPAATVSQHRARSYDHDKTASSGPSIL